MNCMNIGEAAAAAGVTPKMIHHYESFGLIPEVEPRASVAMLRFVCQSRALGFSIQQIGSLLALWRDEQRESRAVKDLARKQLAGIDARQRELDEMRGTLAGLIDNCAGDERACCAILQRPADFAPVEHQTDARKASSTLKQVKAGSSVPRTARQKHPSAVPRGVKLATAHVLASQVSCAIVPGSKT